MMPQAQAMPAQPQPQPPQPGQPTQGADPQFADAVRKVTLAGKKLLYDEKTFTRFEADLKSDAPLPMKLAKAAAGLVKLLDDRANGGIPRRAIVPAATALLLEMVDFVKEAGFANPSEQEIKQAIEIMIKSLLAVYGVTEKVKRAQQMKRAPQQQPQPQQPAQPQQARGLIDAQPGV